MQVKKFYKAREDLQMAVQYAPNDAIAHYNLAALYSQEKQFDRALDSLDTALSRGFDNFDAIRNDPDLARLRKQPEFKTVLEKHRISFSR